MDKKDMTALLAGTHREVRHRLTGAGDARAVRIRRRYEAEIVDVWEACTSPERLKRWFLPVTGDLRPGGTFQLEGNAGGEILRCEPPHLLRVTWRFDDRPLDGVELRLTSGAAGDTVLEIEHTTLSQLVEWDGQKVDVVPGIGTGWELPLTYALPAYLAGELPDAPAAEWFEFTSEVMEIVQMCNQAWATALASAEDDKMTR